MAAWMHRSVDRSVLGCVLRASAEWLSGASRVDGFVAENEEGSHGPETGQQRLERRVWPIRRMMCLPRSFFRS